MKEKLNKKNNSSSMNIEDNLTDFQNAAQQLWHYNKKENHWRGKELFSKLSDLFKQEK